MPRLKSKPGFFTWVLVLPCCSKSLKKKGCRPHTHFHCSDVRGSFATVSGPVHRCQFQASFLLLPALASTVIWMPGKKWDGLACLCGADSSARDREVEILSHDCWETSGRDPGAMGPWVRGSYQVPSNGGSLCCHGDHWGFQLHSRLCSPQRPMSFGDALILPPSLAFTHIYRLGHIYKCACRQLKMVNHDFTHNFPTYHHRTKNNCELKSNFLY